MKSQIEILKAFATLQLQPLKYMAGENMISELLV